MLRGYRILERNYTFGHKEIDIIAKRGKTVAFVEVKTRTSPKVAPSASVSIEKQHNVISAAKAYCASHDTNGCTLRFDIAEVYVNGSINYIKNAYQGH